MKKVLILSYFFPPCNLTASQRAYGWAKNLKRYGYYPVVITRNWPREIVHPSDVLIESEGEIVVEKNDDFEVHYLPYESTLRDKIFIKHGDKKFKLIRKILSLIEVLFQNFSNRVIPYRNFHSYAQRMLQKQKDIGILLITANPFILFKFGYQLHKEFSIPWIADYRDDWTTSELRPYTFLEKKLLILERRAEVKWLGTAAGFTTISSHYAHKIEEFTKVKGHVLLNGFFENDFNRRENVPLDSAFTIIYNGSLYKTQQVEVFLSSFKRFIDQHKDGADHIKIRFIGLSYDKSQEKRVVDQMKSYLNYVEITPRIPRKEVIEMQEQAHVLLMLTHNGFKGVPSSKLYEYLAVGRPIISFPSDNDIVDETLSGYNLGYVCSTEKELLSSLNTLYSEYKEGKYGGFISEKDYVNKFTRKYQAKVLAEIISDLV